MNRLSAALVALVIGLFVLAAVLVFVLQNQVQVEVSFLVFRGRLPLAVALLFAFVMGALMALAFAAARIIQLRVAARRRPVEDRPLP